MVVVALLLQQHAPLELVNTAIADVVVVALPDDTTREPLGQREHIELLAAAAENRVAEDMPSLLLAEKKGSSSYY